MKFACSSQRSLALFTLALVSAQLTTGCGGSSSNGGSSSSSGLAAGGATTVYAVQQPGTGTQSIVQFTAGANGSVSPAATITGPTNFAVSAVAVDASGSIYMGGSLAGQPEVLVFAAGSNGAATPTRTILVGSPSTAYIQSMAVDSSGSLYVLNYYGTVLVYASTATGAATPTRTLSGTSTLLAGPSLYSLALDGAANVYVGTGNASGTGGAIYEFATGATGNVAPTRTITTPSLVFYGVAVDASGNIFAAEDNPAGTTASSIVEFSATASGAASPSKTITLNASTASIYGGLKVDSVGNLYAVLVSITGTGSNATGSYSLVAVGPSATGSTSPATQMTSTAWASAGSQLAIK